MADLWRTGGILNCEYGRWYVVAGRWGRAGFRTQDSGSRRAGSRCQGLNQESAFRRQESEVRSQNEDHLLPAFCLLLTADCLLRLRGVRVGGTLSPYRSLRHVTADGEKKNQ